jgi:muramoyltetrapeptide carboxypeptidase LdcA involved in peptidoglycan recycling
VEIKMNTSLLKLLKGNPRIRDLMPLKIEKQKNLKTFKGPVAPNLRREEDTLEKKRCFQKKKSEKYKKSMKKKDQNWSVLNLLNIIPELEKLPKIKNKNVII